MDLTNNKRSTYKIDIFLDNTLDLVFSGTLEQMKLKYQKMLKLKLLVVVFA